MTNDNSCEPMSWVGWGRVLAHPIALATWALELAALFIITDFGGGAGALLGNFASGVSEWIPFITYLADATAFPEPARACLSVAFVSYSLLLPILAMRAMRGDGAYLISRWKANRRSAYISSVALPVLAVGIIGGAVLSNVDPALCPGCTTNNRVGLFVLYCVVLPCSSAYLVGATVLFYSNLATIFAKNHKRKGG